MPTIHLTETVLRDANQSLLATRLPLRQFEAVLETIDQAGYYSVECWGGATFDACLRYLDEDPWERLRILRKKMPRSRLQMLLRGQNILGYSHYPDDVVRKFVEYSVKNGIDIIRIFDALNDMRNIQVAVEETLRQGAHASGAICYTISPVHTLENYVGLALELEKMGVNSICIKDMAGILSPFTAYQLVKRIKESVNLPVIVHTHCTTGLAMMTCLKAAEAGADVIDTAVSCLSGGTSQPSTETLLYALREWGFDVPVHDKIVKKINDFFKPIRNQFLEDGGLNPKVLFTDADALSYQVPGGMLSNLIAQLKTQHALDRFEEVLQEIPQVRKDLGYPPLVTPMSQMVGVQAAANVLLGERYKSISKEVKAYLRGEYGTAPAPLNPDLQKKALGDEAPLTGRYADTLPPAFEKTKQELQGIARSEEDVLSYLAFPQVAGKFFETRRQREENICPYSILRVEEKEDR